MIADQVGNLYGTTSQGGPSGNGLVFKLTRPAAGKTVWTETVLASFNKTNGAGPVGGLVLDKAGNLYGTTTNGGPAGDGTVFELTPPSGGKGAWKQATLLAFTGINGIGPHGSLTLDAAGNLYGAAAQGGQFGHGAIVKLTPPAAGKTAWSGKVLFSFNQTDGAYPNGGLVFDKMGNLYGTTASGTTIASYGTVFRLSPPAAGKAAWTETTLFDFDKTDGANPDAGVILDAAGRLYGTTENGGTSSAGTVFRLTPPAKGKTFWTETVLINFAGNNGDNPNAGLTMDRAGNLYGVTEYGGGTATQFGGNAFRLSPPAAGKAGWTETILAGFKGANGFFPVGSLIADTAGNLYGTTFNGGKSGHGIVFKLTP